jgi:predicted Zn-dependent protease
MRIQPQIGQPQMHFTPGLIKPGDAGHSSTIPNAKPTGNPLDALEQLVQWQASEEVDRLEVRWALDRMPLSVFIDPHPRQEGLEQALFLAMRQWEVASFGLIRFRPPCLLPAERSTADIIVSWSEQTTLGRDFEVGHTKRTVQGKQIVHAEVVLITEPVIDGHLNPTRQKARLMATILHETGHALGLEHSEQATDVMFHRGWQRPYLSENDTRRIRALYRQ